MADAIREVQKQSKASYWQPIDATEGVRSTVSLENESLALINYESSSDRTGLRHRVWADLCRPNSSDRLVTCLTKPAGVQLFKLVSIYQRNRLYPFWISPRGNGIDCHRTWEALYLDVIPIVWNNSLTVLYEDLPMLVINDHRVLTRAFLEKQLREISRKKRERINATSTKRFRYDKLRNSYWRKLILSKSRYAAETSDFPLQRRCWRAKSSLLELVRHLPFLDYF